MKPALTLCLGVCAVLLASSGQAEPLATRFSVSADGAEVTDSKTGLIWRRCPEGTATSGGKCSGTARTYTHEAALQHAAAQAGSSGKPWRLPDIKELSSIVDRSRYWPAMDTAAFPLTPFTRTFWSTSPYVRDAYYAWYVDFYTGSVFRDFRDNSYYIQLVRAGQ